MVWRSPLPTHSGLVTMVVTSWYGVELMQSHACISSQAPARPGVWLIFDALLKRGAAILRRGAAAWRASGV